MSDTIKVRKNLRFSTIEGTFWAVMYGAGETYLSALAVSLGFSGFQISFLSSFPQFVGSCFQLLTATIKNYFKSIRRFAVIMAFIQSIMWLFLIITSIYMPYYSIILIWACLYFSIDAIIGPAWTAWMGYFVPRRLRARYFGKRNRIIGFVSFISTFIAGFILNLFNDNIIYGFAIIFLAASFGRFFSALYLNKKYYFRDNEESNLFQYINSFKKILNKKRATNYIIFNAYINFSIMFFGPLFSIYILRSMELNMIVYTINMTLWQVSNFTSSNYFGKLCEKFGDFKVLRMATYIIIVLPFLWIMTYYLDKSYQPISTYFLSIIAGFCFSGFTLSSFNLLYEISDKKDVIHFSSIMNFVRGIAILLGGLSAGLIVESNYINELATSLSLIPIHISMGISMILRLFSIPILNKIKLK